MRIPVLESINSFVMNLRVAEFESDLNVDGHNDVLIPCAKYGIYQLGIIYVLDKIYYSRQFFLLYVGWISDKL